MRTSSGCSIVPFILVLTISAFASNNQERQPKTPPSAAPAEMRPITFDKTSLKVDGEPFYLVSGEFHYFRVPKKDWKGRMELFKQAGGNCLATYVPWAIHEPEEGKFVFDTGDGIHDLEAFLRTAKEAGLYVIARPGPYQYSELKYDGLPGWLVDGYPELRAMNAEGRPFRNESVSYIHPLFLEKAKRWFDRVCPVLARHTIANGGPIALVQLDNELIGIHIWFGSIDYHPVSMGFGKKEGRYPQYLWRRFQNIEKMNYDYGTQYTSFHQAKPPKPDGGTDEFELRQRKDYFEFYLETTTEYFQTLARWIRAAGIEVPLVHNAGNPDMDALFVETAAKMGKTFLLGSDHYYNLGPDWPQNNPTPQYALNAFTSLEMLRLMGYPPVVFEIPSGSASDWPPVLPQDARACYMANLAFGMKGHNYYIFTGGPNPPGLGATTDLYDYGAPVGAAGEIRPLYQAQKEFHAFLQKYSWLPQSARESDCRFGLDFDAVRSHHFWKNRGPYPLTGPEAWDFLRRGALTSVMCAGMSPVFVDLGAEGFQRDASSPLVVIASPVMSAAKQMRITEFLRNGGKVLLAPVVPVSDERFNPCTILSEFLGKPDIAASQAAHSRVGFDGIPNVSKAEVFVTRSLPRGAECLAVDEASKKPVAWRLKTEGNGEVIFLGLRWSHGQKEQARMMKVLLDRLGLRQKVTASNPNVWTSVRRAGDRTLLFALNLYSSPQETEIQYRPDGIGKPKVSQKVKLNAMEVKAVEIR